MYMLSKEQYLGQMFYGYEKNLRYGLYHITQILLAYNSNRMEGSPITENETANLFDTMPILVHDGDKQAIVNHFTAFNYILEHIDYPLDCEFIKDVHYILMNNTTDFQDEGFILGDWRQTMRVVGAKPFTPPNRIDEEMHILLDDYHSSYIDADTISDFHGRFENIHPFFNGNRRMGRLLHYKESVMHDITPAIVLDNDNEPYYNGVEMFLMNPQPLRDAFSYYRERYERVIDEEVDTSIV